MLKIQIIVPIKIKNKKVLKLINYYKINILHIFFYIYKILNYRKTINSLTIIKNSVKKRKKRTKFKKIKRKRKNART